MNWTTLETAQQLQDIATADHPCLIFKHSTRCPVSSMAIKHISMDANVIPPGVTVYYLDLIRYRNLSNEVARIWNVKHESPQVLLVEGPICLYHAAHDDIDVQRAVSTLGQA